MKADSTKGELLELLKDSHEYLRYFRELGVEVVEAEVSASATPSATPTAATEVSKPRGAPPETTSWRPSLTARPCPEPPAALFARSPIEPISRPLLAEPSPQFQAANESLEDIWRDIGDCTRCGLCEGRTQVVNTHGNPKARLMFVGEAPGADEDAQGKPFVGRAGQLLTKIIEAIGLKREEVIIGNVNRCRPPGNRQPTLEEAAICRPFLFREIAVIQPEVIVVMGNTALRNLLEVREGITRVRGVFQDFRGIKVMPTFHPAYLLRDPSKKRETWEDLKKVRAYLDETAARQRPS
jgi:DNA polymerase